MRNILIKLTAPILFAFAAPCFADETIDIEQGYVADESNVHDVDFEDQNLIDEHAVKEPKVYNDPEQIEYDGVHSGGPHGGGGHGR